MSRFSLSKLSTRWRYALAALLLAGALGAGLLWGIRRALERPKVADLLIDCETEMTG